MIDLHSELNFNIALEHVYARSREEMNENSHRAGMVSGKVKCNMHFCEFFVIKHLGPGATDVLVNNNFVQRVVDAHIFLFQ